MRSVNFGESDSLDSSLAKRFLSAKAFSKNSFKMIVAYALVSALSIALSQIVVICLLAYTVCFIALSDDRSLVLKSLPQAKLLLAPMISWVAVALLSSVVGVNLFRALADTLNTALYMMLPFAVLISFSVLTLSQHELRERMITCIAAFAVGFILAAVHTIISVGVGFEIRPSIPGPVTESGQLALILPILIGIIVFAGYSSHSTYLKEKSSKKSFRKTLSTALMLFVLCILFAWPSLLVSVSSEFAMRLVQGGAIFAISFLVISRHNSIINSLRLAFKGKLENHPQIFKAFFVIGTAVILAVFILNLKRGPWLGVFTALIALGIFLSKRLFITTLLIAIFGALLLSPARSRIISFAEDFSISGGRQEMWSMGVELAKRFPLGVGLENATVMREIDPSLPLLHRHMHSNFLNIAVETGWLGLFVFIWWMYVVIRLGFDTWKDTSGEKDHFLGIMSLSAASGLLAWQVAGIVEYNFGDGEVRLVAFVLMGLVMVGAYYANVFREQPPTLGR